jgi:hypothetical protein
MNRLYALESTPGVTGAKADHKLKMSPQRLNKYFGIIASRLGVGSAAGSPDSAHDDKWLNTVVADLKARRGKSLVIVDAVVPISLISFWLALFFQHLKARPLLALQDPHVDLILEQAYGNEQ